ncbi:MAG: ankyrin repeat domain-containing protein [Fimbriimonadaceae bacterium]
MSRETEFLDAVRRGDLPTVGTFLDADPELAGTRDENGTRAIVLALRRRQDSVAWLLAERRESPDVFECASIGFLDGLERAIADDPAAVHRPSPDGGTALGLAAEFGELEAARILLSAGADPDRAGADGLAPIHLALAGGHVSVARALLAHGADPNRAAANGWTPLHYAADLGDAEIALELVEAGARPGAKNDDGFDALEWGHEVGHGHVSERVSEAVRAAKTDAGTLGP